MEYIAILISFLALIGAGFAFLRANSSHNILSKRIEILKEKNSSLFARLAQLEGNQGKSNKPGNDLGETERDNSKRNKPRREKELQEEPLQKQPRHEHQESKQKQLRPEKQEQKQKQKEKPRQPQPQPQAAIEQPAPDVTEEPQQKRKKENRRRNETPVKGNYGELERTKKSSEPTQHPVMDTPSEDIGEQPVAAQGNNMTDLTPEIVPAPEPAIAQVPELAPTLPAQTEPISEQQPTRKPEASAEPIVFEPMAADEPGPVPVEVEDSDIQKEFSPASKEEAAPEPTPAPAEKPYGGRRFAVIPEDGVIRMYQLQQRPHTDSFIEVDPPAEGSNNTHYRFSMEGNNTAVEAETIEHLNNAFDFDSPADPGTSKVIQQQDGLLVKVNNGWRIMEKARVDFR